MSDTLNVAALEPLYKPWEEPTHHRVRATTPDQKAQTVKGRRPSKIEIAQNLRSAVREWRENGYFGASDTTRTLLAHWFERPHRATSPSGEDFEFRYYFCQREAIETFIYLKEVRELHCLSQVTAAFGSANEDTAMIQALGITEEEDAWSRYAFKLATGAGKTKVMSLAIAWSYFHASRESDSPMAKHFVVIAPNLTVYERLKDDFGGAKIFDNDPLVPPEWKGDWNPSVVEQDASGGAATSCVIYLTNIHRLYDPAKRRNTQSEMYDWAGPPVSKATALDTAAALRDRITGHRNLMILNDEAHHVWDPDSAWNQAIEYLHNTIRARTGGGLVAQLDFSATPKDNAGRIFKHVICDTPLGEAVDAGIVKTPIIGKSESTLAEEASDNAAYRFDRHLRLGYARWKKSYEEWAGSGKKAILFVMCEDTTAADDITHRLNTDETFKDLNGKTLNLHTNLKGKLKKIGKGASARIEFVESEKDINDEDLKALRKLSRDLDNDSSPYLCIVSVLMLREGWDVKNVTTIVPLRAYSSKANILPEQTLGRGLRRMTPPGGAHELVTVVEHAAFASLYQDELAQEGLFPESVGIEDIPSTTVSIYPDPKKDQPTLEIEIPSLTPAHRTKSKLEDLKIEDVKKEFSKYQKLPLGAKGSTELKYEGRHLFTGEVVERMKINLPLLNDGIGAISYFARELEYICKIRGTHTILAPLLQTFLEEMLFSEKTSLFDPRCISRLGASDVREHVRAVFVPLIRERITTHEDRTQAAAPTRLSSWKPYQASHSERKPAMPAARTLFNLVPCDRALEQSVAAFMDGARDVAAFAKNAGPQCLRIDFITFGGRLSFYRPDFFVRRSDSNYYLVETKGREDRDVPLKARAAIQWCQSASTDKCKWEYVFIPQGIFEGMRGDTFAELARTCQPSLQQLIEFETAPDLNPLLAYIGEQEAEKEKSAIEHVVDEKVVAALPDRYRRAVDHATLLYHFTKNKSDLNFAPVFSALLGSLDDACRSLMFRQLAGDLPAGAQDQKAWFSPYLEKVDFKKRDYYNRMANNLKRTLVFRNGLSPLGLLSEVLDFALNDHTKLGGVFDSVKNHMRFSGGRKLLDTVQAINQFRNTVVAHQERELTDPQVAHRELATWISGLLDITRAPDQA